MLTYIINTTAIWLIALLAFDMLLRKEASHSYNRAYLIFILFAGALIPLWSWDYDSVIYTTGVTQPITTQTELVKSAIVAETEATMLSLEQWLWIVYLVGVSIAALLLFRDIIMIAGLYKNGIKSKDGTWTIIETGKATSPFSAFRYIFISSKGRYSSDELKMILAHEEQHGRLLHSVDVLFTRLLLILFWFNPLVYIIEKRLRMVHEFQADAVATEAPSEYGRFLIEQSALHTPPHIAHSFTSSPLKNRIVMLTKNVNNFAKGKQLIIVPVLLVAMLCFTQNAFSGDKPDKDGNKITYKGNVFETKTNLADTLIIINPKTGKEEVVITKREIPDAVVKMNGEQTIMVEETLANLAVSNAYSRIKNEVGVAVQPLISKLVPAYYKYDLYNIVINKKGEVVYYEVGGVEEVVMRLLGSKGTVDKIVIDEDVKTEINTAIANAVKDIRVTPISMDGENKICVLRIQEHFEVE